MKNLSISSSIPICKQTLSFLFWKFSNQLMLHGKKNTTEKILFNSLVFLRKKEKTKPLLVFLRALRNSMPFLEVRSVRRGGASYQIPVPLKENRALSLGMKWIINSAKNQTGPLITNLVSVLVETSKNQGDVIKKRDALHNTAFKNRSLTHYRWY